MSFDAPSLDPSAMYDEGSVFLKTESGYACKPHMKNIFIDDFKIKTFNEDDNDSAFSIKYITTHLILYFNIYQLKKKWKS